MDDSAKYQLLKILTEHTGRTRAIGMGELFTAVYGEPWQHRINDTRKLRNLVTELKKDGVPVCSVSDSTGGGYYLASAGSELDDYCKRLRIRALKILAQEARLRKLALPELLGQISLACSSEV
jgi:hypothetical protein